MIENTRRFNLDASNYLAYPLPNDDQISITLSINKTQAYSNLSISIKPYLQLELNTDNPGCYIKYTIPYEFILPNS